MKRLVFLVLLFLPLLSVKAQRDIIFDFDSTIAYPSKTVGANRKAVPMAAFLKKINVKRTYIS